MSLWAKFKRSVFINLAPRIIYFFIWIIFLTCKKSFSKTNLTNEPCVVLFWHGRLALMSFAYVRWWRNGQNPQRRAKVIISDHKDGEIIARVISFFGIGAIRGSSSKGAVKALAQSFRELKSGIDVIITPDGPRGPYHSVADGAVVIAQKQNAPIQILNYEASKFWQLKSWDKMIIPKPFSEISYTLSPPFSVADMALENARELIKKEMEK